MRFLFLILTALATTPWVWAQKFQGRYGPEFTFGKLSGVEFLMEDKVFYEEAAFRHLVSNQPEGQKFKSFTDMTYGRLGLYSPNGWYFTISKDPGVLEVQMKPMTVENYKKYAGDIQDGVFVTAANLNMAPFEYLGGGHINIDLKPFNGDALLIRNFIVDFWNHNELALGIFNYDTSNAISIWVQEKKYADEVKEVIERLDQGDYSLNNPVSYLEDFLVDLNRLRTNSIDALKNIWSPGSHHRYKSTDITFSQAIDEDRRLEIRAVRPQKDIYQWIRQIELLDARINYLAKFKGPIPLRPIVPVFPIEKMDSPDDYKLDPPVNPQDALKAFYLYVTDSGLSWKNYRDDVWPRWVQLGLVDEFEASEWFQSREKNCWVWL